MKINKLFYQNYRNLEDNECTFSENVNIIYGGNGQGKTNMLESLWLLCGAKSFRGNKDNELIKFGHDKAIIKAEFFAEERTQDVKIIIENRRKITLNGIDLPSANKLAGKILCVVFIPEHLSLIKRSAQGRRLFIDSAICQLYPKYINTIKKYQTIINQRNTLLKDIRTNKDARETLFIWDENLSNYASEIYKARSRYIKLIREHCIKIYDGISKGSEQLDIYYEPDISCDNETEYKNIYLNILKESLEEDIRIGYTTRGPHRDDLISLLNNKNARSFASQGQQRSIVLSLKLSEAEIIKEITGEAPFILFDDVMSELDSDRREYLLSKINNWQIFITCCDIDDYNYDENKKIFNLKNGQVKEIKNI